MNQIEIEGTSIAEILEWPEENFDALVLLNRPIAIKIGSAEVLGQFAVVDERLVVELAQIEGGGEGVLPVMSRMAKHIAGLKKCETIECVIHALDCAKPNLKLRAHLEKTGFLIKDVPGKGQAFYKQIPIA